MLFIWFGVGWTAGTNARWMGWAEGYKGLQQPWLNIMVQSLALRRLINPCLFGVFSAHNSLGYEGHDGIRDLCVQVLSFRIRFYLVMRHIVQLLRPCEDKKRWIHLFSGKRKKRKKISERQFWIFLPLIIKTSTNNSQGANKRFERSFL